VSSPSFRAATTNPGPSLATAPGEEIVALQRWAKRAAELHKRIAALHHAGAVGGEAEDETLARYHMLIANARLAFAQGQIQQCAKSYAGAVEAAENCVDATTAAYEADTVSVDRLVLAHQQLAEARIALSRLRDR